MKQASAGNAVSTTNACSVCAPLGAALAFRGVAGCMPVLHGSQGCATYIRRYVIGHFREPIDIASSSFSEQSTIFGGAGDLKRAVENVVRQYDPEVVGIATTCLAETIGENVPQYLRELTRDARRVMPPLVHVSTPSYSGSHLDGYHAAVRALVERFAGSGVGVDKTVLLPGLVSTADIRHLKDVMAGFGLPCVVAPDYSDTLDGGSWSGYEKIPAGGTTVDELRQTGRCRAAIELGGTVPDALSAAAYLGEAFSLPFHRLPLPVGLENGDRFFGALAGITGRPVPARYQAARRRLVDAYVDGHKFAAGRFAAVYGDEETASAVAAFLEETGIRVSLCVTGGSRGRMKAALERFAPVTAKEAVVLEDADFEEMRASMADVRADIMVGHGKGYALARQLDVPLVRVGFPVHDRMGAQRIRMCGYEGTLDLYDRIINALLERRQADSAAGYLTW